MTKNTELLQKTTKFLKLFFGRKFMKKGRGFLATKGADRERKSVKEKAPGRADARLGAGCV